MRHAMLDIETLGKKPGCAILSIGAVLFNPHGKGFFGWEGSEFYKTIDLTSQVLQEFKIDPETVKWWQSKDAEAKIALSEKTETICTVLHLFADWCKLHNVTRIWCQGATFDAPILQEAYEMMKIETPWKFYEVRDTRTVYDLCEFDQYSIKREGVFHNALDDAKHQITCVQTALLKNPIK